MSEIDDAGTSITSLQGRVFALNKEMSKLNLSIATTLNESKMWTVVSRVLSGSGLWQLQNRIRAVVGVFDVMNKRQEKAREADLKRTNMMIEMSKIEKEVEKKRKALDTQDGRRLRSAFEHYKLLKDTNELSKEEILPLLEREVSYMEKINKQAKEKLIGDVERFKQMGKISMY